ncbi:MAG: type II toxin-antitoxin system VapC family toxin [Syntrophales bacterium LBB04]|nr:type II toxin-antitoxin system VapC family toxin [Syntrophales bacterium LBB04]
MVLVDTSVWVSHFRQAHRGLVGLLNDGEVACHPFIVGELACGNLKNRTTILTLLDALPMASAVEHHEALTFIESRSLMGKGLGYIDIHLLASCILSGLPIWTLDKKLEQVADMARCRYRLETR